LDAILSQRHIDDDPGRLYVAAPDGYFTDGIVARD
jgi:hypothetical protein